MHDVLTSRLILRLMQVEFLEACVAGDLASAEKVIGFGLSDEILASKHWMGIRINDIRKDPEYRPWSPRAIALASSKVMVGHIGFHSRPNPEYLRPFIGDGIELGYLVFSAYRRQRYAQEAIRGLMGWAAREHAVRTFSVSVAPANTPSLALAGKLGFRKVGERMDEEGGLEYVHVLRPPAPQ